jgi:copper chaperone NosL
MNIKTLTWTAFLALILAACSEKGPEPVKLNTDHCDFCKMTIADLKFATELITVKGRVYKFDDLHCLVGYVKANKEATSGARLFVADFVSPEKFIDATKAYYIRNGELRSPMGGNTAGFSNQQDASSNAARLQAEAASWQDVKP